MFERLVQALSHPIKNFLHIVHTLGEQTVQAIVGGGTGFLASMAKIPGALLGLGLTSALSVGIMEAHYRNERNEIKDIYKDELAQKLGKSPDKVTDKDLDLLAKGDAAHGIAANPVIAEALKKAKRERNLGVATATLASLGTMIGTAALLGAGGLLAATPVGVALAALGGGAQLLLHGAIGIALYEVIKAPLTFIGKKLFGMDHTDAHERIMAVYRDHERGKTISREQVVGIMVAANPELDKRIAANFGKAYEKMDSADQERVATNIAGAMPVDQLTDAINNGSLKVTELAFAGETRVAFAGRQTVIEPAGEMPTASFVQRLAAERANQTAPQR